MTPDARPETRRHSTARALLLSKRIVEIPNRTLLGVITESGLATSAVEALDKRRLSIARCYGRTHMVVIIGVT